MKPVSDIRRKKSKRWAMPFSEPMKKAIVHGKKNKTTRYNIYNVIQDMFYFQDDDESETMWEVVFTVGEIKQCRLSEAVEFWKDEGFDSKEDMIDLWKKLHPGRGYRATDAVYIHDIVVLDKNPIGGVVTRPTILPERECIHRKLWDDGSKQATKVEMSDWLLTPVEPLDEEEVIYILEKLMKKREGSK